MIELLQYIALFLVGALIWVVAYDIYCFLRDL